MRSTPKSKLRRAIEGGRVLKHSAFLFVLVLAASAQAPPIVLAPRVPLDHYGPPLCPGTSMRSGEFRDRAAEARAAQAAGADDPHALLSAEPMENFQLVRYRLQDYADCVGPGGCYWADLDAQYRRAEEALAARVSRRRAGERLAIVMDIDETSLSGYCEMRREDFGYIGAMFNSWVVGPEAAVAIPGGLRLFNAARREGVAVFFITGRPGMPDAGNAKPQADQTAATARNLQTAGYYGWSGLALRNGAENGMSTIAYKSSERAKILARGYRIVLSVGDQWSDLEGDPKAEVSVKLPNPFYFLP
jgi:hypothetical protein